MVVIRAYHGLQTAVQRRRAFTGSLWSMLIMISSGM